MSTYENGARSSHIIPDWEAEAQRAQAGWVKEIETNRVLRHQIIALQKDARNRT